MDEFEAFLALHSLVVEEPCTVNLLHPFVPKQLTE